MNSVKIFEAKNMQWKCCKRNKMWVRIWMNFVLGSCFKNIVWDTEHRQYNKLIFKFIQVECNVHIELNYDSYMNSFASNKRWETIFLYILLCRILMNLFLQKT